MLICHEISQMMPQVTQKAAKMISGETHAGRPAELDTAGGVPASELPGGNAIVLFTPGCY
jgi:hypothetical protein